LSLLPLSFLLVGIVRGGLRSLIAWRSWGVPQSYDYAGYFLAVVCVGYITFIVKFTADYRDFAAMKLIYMLPGVLPFAWLLADGMQTVVNRWNSNKWAVRLVQLVLLCLVISHCLNIVALIIQLAEQS
jgi:hypothetical protein